MEDGDLPGFIGALIGAGYNNRGCNMHGLYYHRLYARLSSNSTQARVLIIGCAIYRDSLKKSEVNIWKVLELTYRC